jgi:hypothetical protein
MIEILAPRAIDTLPRPWTESQALRFISSEEGAPTT